MNEVEVEVALPLLPSNGELEPPTQAEAEAEAEADSEPTEELASSAVTASTKPAQPPAVLDAAAELRLEQIHKFVAENAANPLNRKRIRNLLSLSDASFETYKLGVIVANCCRDMNLQLAVDTYHNAKAHGHNLSSDSFYNLLSLVAGLGDQGSGSGPPREIEPPHDVNAACLIFADMKRLQISLSESNYTAMIRCYSINQRAAEALQLYHEMIGGDQPTTPKLRTYTHMLAAFAAAGNEEICFALYHDIVHRFNLPLMEREYLSLLRVTTLTGNGQRFFDVLHQLMEDVLVPTVEHAWPVFRAWFETRSAVFEATLKDNGEVVPITIPESDSVTPSGIELKTPTVLQSIELDGETKLQLLQQIESFALNRAYSREPGGNANVDTNISNSSNINTNSDTTATTGTQNESQDVDQQTSQPLENKQSKHEAKWQSFKSWLQSAMTGGSLNSNNKRGLANTDTPDDTRLFNIIVDGANIGYYKQNFAGAPKHVAYVQIDWMVRQLQSRGYRPLLVLHARHLHPDRVPPQYAAIVARWKDERCLYITPSGWNDDWFWLFAAVSLGCHIVTNDEMRDHHFLMLSPRWFCRWKERHQVHFTFGLWTLPGASSSSASTIASTSTSQFQATNEDAEPIGQEEADILAEISGKQKSAAAGPLRWREAQLTIPSVYSRRIQHLVTDGGAVEGYYFPGLNSETWLCAVIDRRRYDGDGSAGLGDSSITSSDTTADAEYNSTIKRVKF